MLRGPPVRSMPSFDFSIRTKLVMWAGLGVALVAGLLVQQQMGDRYAAQQRAVANAKELAAIEALRAAKDLGAMRLELREMRLAIAPSDVDKAQARLSAFAKSGVEHLKTADGLSDDPSDKQGLDKIAALAGDYVAVSKELAVAAKEYGDTAEKVQRAGKLGTDMNDQIDRSTAMLIDEAEALNAAASQQRLRVGRTDL